MATDIVIPKLGMTMTQATVSEWLLAEGDRVEEGQNVLVIETEKVSYEVEALASGFLHILAGPGTVAEVGEPVGQLAATVDELAGLQKDAPAPAAPAPAGADAAPPAPTPEAAPQTASADRIKISPVARKIAAANNLDVGAVQGTGPGGRIKRADVERALAERRTAKAAPVPAEPEGETLDGKRVLDRLPLAGLRGMVAEHMQRSLAVSAQLTSMGEFDATELVRLREALLVKESAWGVRVTYTDIVVYMLSRVLRENPIINSSLIDNQIVLWDDINIGVAVSLPWEQYDAGLIVPVVRRADRMTLVEISRENKRLREKALSGSLALEEVTGGTFTLSNVGSFGRGYSFSTPIISQPQSAILLTGAITDRALVVDGRIEARSVMNWSFTFDHRAINGAPVGKFLSDLNDLITNPYLLIR